jgi:hypothetical protein
MTDIEARDCSHNLADTSQNLADFTIESLRQQLAESQAQVNQLNGVLRDTGLWQGTSR